MDGFVVLPGGHRDPRAKAVMAATKGAPSEAPIVVVEPQCEGFEHARFNAPFLHALTLAAPASSILFLAEQKHGSEVRKQLEQYSPETATRIEWLTTTIPKRSATGWMRLPAEYRWSRSVLSIARERSAGLLVLTSATMVGLLALSRVMGSDSLPVLSCLHSEMRLLLSSAVRHPGRWGWDPSHVLRLPSVRRFDFVMLGEALRREALALAPYLDPSHWHSIEHPFHFREGIGAPKERRLGTVVCGFLGAALIDKSDSRGFAAFCRLAAEISRDASGAEFRLVGFVKGEAPREEEGLSYVTGVSYSPISAEEYDARAAEIDFAVFTAPAGARRLLASTAFLDGLNFGKPGVYLRNPYLEHYFEELGDIGYLCSDLGEVAATLGQLCQGVPRERYLQQVAAIERGRWLFSPNRIAQDLEQILSRVFSRSS